ncbi:NUDIX domain-containing protein [Corynebacterium freiburgense]|nr:NUDIX domain-containing protein [Corynebacterium freiburgense]WJZ02958.1 NUDIX domain protein [Corynebacterium freiburgense]
MTNYDYEKVFIYVFDRSLTHVLSFTQKHFPNAGLQVPAGTREPGEKLEECARRELYEESGLILNAPMMYLGQYLYDMGKFKDETHLRNFFWIKSDLHWKLAWTNVDTANQGNAAMIANFRFIPVEESPSLLIADHGLLVLIAQKLALKHNMEN